ncbi:MAG: hypothetical protein HY875_08665 [Chloroflexi bacterium]|nr:hypothetical protein [Chloroflexota bacterium]
MPGSEPGGHPLQNRVTPFGEIVATPARGTLMGNRGGCFHDGKQRLGRRRWVSRRWITCLLEYRGWHREVMTPGRYTELFFLDEATAFAAGHRPCALCRRGDFERFVAAWLAGNPGSGLTRAGGIDPIDRVLHGERTRRDVTPRVLARAGDLPAGVFVATSGDPGRALLWTGKALLPWAAGGYGSPLQVGKGQSVTVLTAASVVRAFAAGYVAGVHPSGM